MKESVAAAWVFSGLISELGPRHALHMVLGKGFWVLGFGFWALGFAAH